ncbi:DUF1934 domain-containing protein [Clostridium thermobutyricum]|uniref:DUF1934 domain-containing protein n=2 Tax=Clostridium thermobutyricum TaxID=29372 RepID=N9WDV7_9CLOT|nr:DUF1934 domain-containing protein [Clostridium thermobutyricum]ENZ01030.1 hypothetical protein HMPREF1092_02199 [Clostridium thermobutyricum]OPX49029.1 putative beta-barrel protein YwiB [Clostridium thermobutyricum DSM 4928]
MEKDAVIKILSNATMENNELIEVLSPGKFIITEDEFVAKYKETEISGMAGTNTTLRVNKDYVVLEREGSTSTKMDFRKGESTVSLYNTPYGMLELTINTHKLNIDVTENGGKVFIEYDMKVLDQAPFKTQISLDIQTK